MKKILHSFSIRNAASAIIGSLLFLFIPSLHAQEEDEALYELSPFTIEAEEDVGYKATSTLAGTRLRTKLEDIGSAVSVFTEEFLEDTNSNNAEDLLVFAPSTEVAGQGGNFVGQGGGAILDTTTRSEPVSTTRVRGLAKADNTRDFFLSDIPWDGYNITRVDVQRGSNAILFGIGSPAGIVNAAIKTAFFDDEYEVTAQIGSFGSNRFTADFNKVIIEDELAIRVNLLSDNTDYKQDPAFRDDERISFAAKWTPKALSSDNYNTEIALNYEDGEVKANYPRLTPPMDAITPWFTDLNKMTIDGRTAGFLDEDWLGAPGSRVWDGVVTQFDPNQGSTHISQTFAWPLAASDPNAIPVATGGRTLGIVTYNNFASNASLNGSEISAYKAKSLTDPTFFDFYNHLLEGHNKSEFNEFDSFNFALRQNFFNNKFGYEVAWDKQDASWGYKNFMSGDAAVITVDMMEFWQDGTPNPNVGRPMTIAGGGSAGGYIQDREREVKRATVYGELDFRNSENETLGKILGKHVFTGLLSNNKIDNTSRNWFRQFIGDSYVPNNRQAIGQASRDPIIYSYLGGSLSGASSIAGANIDRVRNIQTQEATNVTVWNNEVGAWTPYPLEIVNADNFSDRDRPYRNGTLTDREIDSEVLVWQGTMFDGLVIPMFGWRKDEDTARSAGSPPTRASATHPGATPGGIVNINDSSWVLPSTGNFESGESISKSLVIHAPENFEKSLGVGISLHYAESENFEPDASRIDVLGNPVASPNGSTEEYGISFSALDDKLYLKINKYKTSVNFATAGGAIGGNYLIGAIEAWGQRAAVQARDGTGSFGTVFGQSTSGQDVRYRPARRLSSAEDTYTQEELDSAFAIQTAAVDAWLGNPVSQQFQTTWALGDYANGEGVTNFGPPGLVVTADTQSEGTEFELVANPVPGLSIAVNASKNEAQRNNLASSYIEWVDARWADFQGAQGDIRIWGPDPDGDGGESTRGKYGRETISGLNFWNALQGSNVPELVEWRYNAIANYDFLEGRLKGLNIGGAFRYSEAPTVGFPVISGDVGNTYDVANPWKGKSEDIFDFWVGWEMQLTDKIHWRVQANVRNAFGGNELFPVTVQPDGSGGTYRIGPPRTWTIKNTFKF
jgi:outer membrane receptor protein involved in Fe transport